MKLFAYNLIGEPGELLIWVGVLDVAIADVTDFARRVTFSISGKSINLFTVDTVIVKRAFTPLGDEVCDSVGNFLNYSAIFSLPWPDTADPFDVTVALAGQSALLTSKRPLQSLPDKKNPAFNLLLSSCYYRANDYAFPTLGDTIRQIKPRPDFILLAGDQVYLDLPTTQQLSTDRKKLARTLGEKYRENWFPTGKLAPGLSKILNYAPILCIPDDHEFWNNFPLRQGHMNNTYLEKDRNNWKEIATTLFKNYQMTPAMAQGYFRWDIEPLSMLFLDGRSARTSNDCMFTQKTRDAIQSWKQNLLERKAGGQPAVGLLSSGQALIIEKPNYWERNVADMEMINYRDFKCISDALNDLFANGIPVLYITGDVHWGRILQGQNQKTTPLFYEVIASPSRLLETVGGDHFKRAINSVRDLLGHGKDFPVHSEPPAQIPDVKFPGMTFEELHRQSGDHVAMLSFHAIPKGIEFSVHYICTDPDEKKRAKYSETIGPFKLTSS